MGILREVRLDAGVVGFAESNVFNGRLDYQSVTEVRLNQYNGNYVEVNGDLVAISASGIALLTTDNLITASGTDIGSAMASGTLYYVYVSNSEASFAPLDLRGSETSPSLYEGVEYLGASGNASNWRFVGWVRTDNSTQFVSSTTQRFVISKYNRKKMSLLANPGYNNDDNPETYTLSPSTNFTELNGGSGARVEFISNGEDTADTRVTAHVRGGANLDSVYVGIGYDSGSSASVAGWTNTRSSLTEWLGCSDSIVLSEGYHYVTLLGATPDSTDTMTFYADVGRAGSLADPRGTMMVVDIMG